MWLLACLPSLHWFGSLVNGAVVLTSPSNLTHLLHPSPLERGPHAGLSVIDKERGPELPARWLFQSGIVLMANTLAPEDFEGFMPPQAWSILGFILGVNVDEATQTKYRVVQRGIVLNALYFIFLLMKQENNFRSGIFEIQYLGISVCDIVIFSETSSGLHLAPGFPPITQLHLPPSSIADKSKGFSQLELPDLGMLLNVTVIMPFLVHQLDKLGQLINIVDMLFTLAKNPANETVHENIESTVPSSGVKFSLNLTQDDVPKPLTYDDLIWAVSGMSGGSEVFDVPGQALRGQMYLDKVYQGELTMLPSTSSPSTSPLIEASGNTSTGTATARKRWSMVERLGDAGRS